MKVDLIQPNPILTQNIAEFQTPKRMFREDRKVVIMPDSCAQTTKICLGTVGFLNDSYLYPFLAAGDIGCGVGALLIPEDVELPENYLEIISQIIEEDYTEGDEEEQLGLSFDDYTTDPSKTYLTFCKLMTDLVNSGSNDIYLTSAIISPNFPLDEEGGGVGYWVAEGTETNSTATRISDSNAPRLDGMVFKTIVTTEELEANGIDTKKKSDQNNISSQPQTAIREDHQSVDVEDSEDRLETNKNFYEELGLDDQSEKNQPDSTQSGNPIESAYSLQDSESLQDNDSPPPFIFSIEPRAWGSPG